MFTVTGESSLTPAELWARAVDFGTHTATVPLTTTRTDDGEPREGWSFTVRTTLGPVRLDDTMVVAVWEPPKRWRVHKTGPIHGWAEGAVSPSGGGSRLTWTEELWFGGKLLSPLTRRVGDLVGPLLFGPVVRRIATVAR